MTMSPCKLCNLITDMLSKILFLTLKLALTGVYESANQQIMKVQRGRFFFTKAQNKFISKAHFISTNLLLWLVISWNKGKA